MAEFQIKLTKEQHDFLVERLGTDEAIREWLQSYLNQKLLEKAEELNKSSARVNLSVADRL